MWFWEGDRAQEGLVWVALRALELERERGFGPRLEPWWRLIAGHLTGGGRPNTATAVQKMLRGG